MDIIAIDCGASFIKATQFSYGKIVKTVVKKTPADLDNEKLRKSEEIITEIIEQLSADLDEIHIGFSNEMHGFVLTDQDGVPVLPYISWQKELGDLEGCNNLFDPDLIKATGMPLKLGLPSVNLYYLIKNKQIELHKQLYFYTLGDYYIRVITGQQPYTHATNAAATGLYDVAEKKWITDLLKEILGDDGLNSVIFPEIYQRQKEICIERNKKKFLFYPALGDQQAALLGAQLENEDEISLNFGTGAQISILSKKIECSQEYQIRPYFENYFLKTVPHIPSGRALNVYFNFIKDMVSEFSIVEDETLWKYINSQARKNQYQNMKIDMSFFSNAITDHDVGSIENIQEGNFKVGNFFDSIYTQMADNVEIVYKKLGRPFVDKILISGGVLNKNDYLREKVLAKFSDVNSVYMAKNETADGIKKFIESITGRIQK